MSRITPIFLTRPGLPSGAPFLARRSFDRQAVAVAASIAPAFQGTAFQTEVDPEDFLERYKQLTTKQKRAVLFGLVGVVYSLWQVVEKLNEHPNARGAALVVCGLIFAILRLINQLKDL